MFHKREETDKLISAALKVFGRHERGDIVTHEELSAAIGYTPDQPRYFALIRRAREKHCDMAGIWTRPIPSVGFLLLTPREQITEEQHARRQRARRQIRIGLNVAASTPDEALSDHERRVKHHAMESHKRLQQDLLAEERRERWFLKPSPDRPVRLAPPRIANTHAQTDSPESHAG